MHSYADTFISKTQLSVNEPVYPLQCFLDQKTGHVTLGHKTDSNERYNLYDYSYTSSNSKFARNHWDNYAKNTVNKTTINQGKILEIGSNDGYLSNQYQKLGFEVLGVDPSKYIAKIAEKNGVKTYCDIFDYNTSNAIKSKHGEFNMVVANNVFNHSNDPIDFAKGVKNVLDDQGVFIFEVPYWYNTIKDRRFDQIYHEHPNYFTVKSACNLLKESGLYVYDVEWVDYHGGSIRVYARKHSLHISDNVSKFINKEEKEKLFKVETYVKYMKDIKIQRAQRLSSLYNFSQFFPIVGVGAAAKGNTFLNFYNLDYTVLDYITDASEHKIGKYTPLSRIPIMDDETVFKKYNTVGALILSWNISEILKEKLKLINDKIIFL